jgi:hypothetical protein
MNSVSLINKSNENLSGKGPSVRLSSIDKIDQVAQLVLDSSVPFERLLGRSLSSKEKTSLFLSCWLFVSSDSNSSYKQRVQNIAEKPLGHILHFFEDERSSLIGREILFERVQCADQLFQQFFSALFYEQQLTVLRLFASQENSVESKPDSSLLQCMGQMFAESACEPQWGE